MLITPWDLLSKAIPRTEVQTFEFAMPIIHKANDGKGHRYIKGVASTPDKDLQDEFVVQKGMDLRYFLQHGYFNDDHKSGPENKVGEPTVAEVKQVKDSADKSVTGLWVEGYLWPEKSHEGADNIWKLAKALEAASSKRKMGFSIQGKVLRREGNKILKAWIQDIAITASPVNTATWLDLVEELDKSLVSMQERKAIYKSIGFGSFASQSGESLSKSLGGKEWLDEIEEKAMSAGYGAAFSPESLDDALKIQTYGSSKADKQSKETAHRTANMNKSLSLEDAIIKGYTFARLRGNDRETALRLSIVAATKQVGVSFFV